MNNFSKTVSEYTATEQIKALIPKKKKTNILFTCSRTVFREYVPDYLSKTALTNRTDAGTHPEIPVENAGIFTEA